MLQFWQVGQFRYHVQQYCHDKCCFLVEVVNDNAAIVTSGTISLSCRTIMSWRLLLSCRSSERKCCSFDKWDNFVTMSTNNVVTSAAFLSKWWTKMLQSWQVGQFRYHVQQYCHDKCCFLVEVVNKNAAVVTSWTISLPCRPIMSWQVLHFRRSGERKCCSRDKWDNFVTMSTNNVMTSAAFSSNEKTKMLQSWQVRQFRFHLEQYCHDKCCILVEVVN